jgi:hypothetical protein
MSNVLISVPSECIRTKVVRTLGDNKKILKTIHYELVIYDIPEDWIWGWDSSSESFNKFWKECIQGHMYKNGKVIWNKKDLIR